MLAVTDSAGRRVSFEQSNELLQSSTTATGGVWKYEYANGRLTRAVDPTNRVALLAKYDASGRVSGFGDAVGMSNLAYKLNAGNISTITTVTDSLNYTRAFQQNGSGITTLVSDQKGTLLNLLYNQANRAVQITDANGATTTLDYDAQQRLTRQVLPNGDEKTFEYDANGKIAAMTENGERTDNVHGSEAGNPTETRIHKNGKSIKSVFNKRGQETHLQVEGGVSVDNEYDAKGRKTADVYSDIGRFERTFDDAGRKTSEKTPSGLTRGYEYNADNQIVRQSDNRGHSGRVERDASGNLTKIVNQNTEVQISRDEAGRIVQLKNSRGQSRRYAYDSRGALTEFIGADGRDLQFQYNERGELQDVINAQNANLIYQRNQLGSLVTARQQSTNRNNFWQIQKINYVSAFTNTAVDQSCAFGDAFYSGAEWGMDSWSSSDSIFAEANSGVDDGCYDPFANMWGGGGDFGFGGETCYQCISRQHRIADSQYNSCLETQIALRGGAGLIAGGRVGGVIGTVIAPETLGGGTVIGGVAGGLIGGIAGTASAYFSCHDDRDAQYESARDRCPVCNG